MIIDISQEVFSCNVFPGDPSPVRTVLMQTSRGDICNLSSISMCVHNGTHIDAPYHFYGSKKTVDQMDLDSFVGDCYVIQHNGDVTAEDAKNILQNAKKVSADKRILISGKAVVTAEAARVFADACIKLIGNESQNVGPENAPKEVHDILLGAEIVLLEGIVLTNVENGKYFLSAAPINLGGCDGAPCRAYLIK